MQEQSFEDGVRRKMEELSFPPSAPVWLEVEAQIRKKDRRRRLLVFWLLPLLLAAGLMTYKSSSIPKPTITPAVASAPVVKETDSQQITTGKNSVTRNQSKPVAGETLLVFNASQLAEPKISHKRKHTVKSNRAKALKQLSHTDGKNDLALSEAISTSNKPRPSAALEIYADTNSVSMQIGKVQTLTSTMSSVDTINKTTVAAIIADPTENDSTIVVGKKSPPIPKKWNWSLLANTGLSSVSQNLFAGSTVAFDRASPLTSTPQTPVSNSTPVLRKSAAFSVGAAANRELTKRLKITVGLQYAYFSTRFRVGQKVNRDTTVTTGGFSNTSQDVRSYYVPGSANDYTNKYHFLQLPIGLEWKPSRSIPLSLDFGLNISRLVATNHLERTATGNIYYRSADGLNQTQVFLYSGINYSVWHNAKHAVHLGPYLQYGLTPLQKEMGHKRLTFLGIQTRLSF